MQNARFTAGLLVVAAVTFLAARLIDNAYVFFAGYVVLQYIVLATAWNILGGYAGYVNFGTAAFFALGAYSTVALNKLLALPLPAMMVAEGCCRAQLASAPDTLRCGCAARSSRSQPSPWRSWSRR